DGSDGPWSTFAFRVGTPPQTVKLLIATSGQETWVVNSGACASAGSEEETALCDRDRGFTFNVTNSESWSDNGDYVLEEESNLGYGGIGNYGFDVVTVGWEGSGGPKLDDQIVAAIMAEEWTASGMFGVSPRPTNFTDFRNPRPSFLSSLRERNLVPSLSYGYTAGSRARAGAGVLGSLTLGGYDASRRTINDVTFQLSSVTYRDVVVGLRSVRAPGALSALSSSIYAFLDAGTPHIWLPEDACEIIASAYGLTYDEESDLYLWNETARDAMDVTSASGNLEFELAPDVQSGPSVTITVPFTSLDMVATSAYPGLGTANTSRYFPMRRAANATQFTLGRAFFQDSFLIVDYERGNFSVAQARFDSQASPDLVTIKALGSDGPDTAQVDADDSRSSSSSLSTPAKAGVIAGGVLLLLVLLILALGAYRR
ncbi:aspartic peptidase domain-containing protein, partial [Lineolata rhizophorae]